MGLWKNNRKYLAAFLAYTLVAGGVTGFVVDPVLDVLVAGVGLTSRGTLYLLYTSVNLCIGYVVFRFFVWHFFARQGRPTCPESPRGITEPTSSGDAATRAAPEK